MLSFSFPVKCQFFCWEGPGVAWNSPLEVQEMIWELIPEVLGWSLQHHRAAELFPKASIFPFPRKFVNLWVSAWISGEWSHLTWFSTFRQFKNINIFQDSSSFSSNQDYCPKYINFPLRFLFRHTLHHFPCLDPACFSPAWEKITCELWVVLRCWIPNHWIKLESWWVLHLPSCSSLTGFITF